MPSTSLQDQLNNIVQSKFKHDNFKIVEYNIVKNEQMLGFLGDYFNLRVIADDLVSKETVEIFFFVKSFPVGNETKAKAVKELGVFDIEGKFYSMLRPAILREGFRKWSPDFFGHFENDIVLEDLKASGYRIRDKFKPYDMAHVKQALLSLASFHASSFIFEEEQKMKYGVEWKLEDHFGSCLSSGGYEFDHFWFKQCMLGALEALKTQPKYRDMPESFDERWNAAWVHGLAVTKPSYNNRKGVLSHRDVWCNNILFHYNQSSMPDSCVFVDYQAMTVQPPAGDFMYLLYTNTTKEFMDNNLKTLAEFYFKELERLVKSEGYVMSDILTREEFYLTLEEQRRWALIVSACLFPQIWLDDSKVTELFSDSENYEEYLVTKKGEFIVEMFEKDKRYKEKILLYFEEIAERYVL